MLSQVRENALSWTHCSALMLSGWSVFQFVQGTLPPFEAQYHVPADPTSVSEIQKLLSTRSPFYNNK